MITLPFFPLQLRHSPALSTLAAIFLALASWTGPAFSESPPSPVPLTTVSTLAEASESFLTGRGPARGDLMGV